MPVIKKNARAKEGNKKHTLQKTKQDNLLSFRT
jgi:hypothetical protein